MVVEIKRHGKCEFVGFSRASDKQREKGYLDGCHPLFKIDGYESPQVISRSDIISDFPIKAWCIVDVGKKKEIREVQITIRYQTIGSIYYLSKHNAEIFLKENK
jgi:hypothetical protein